jgi:GrpB-like predicted nucleotidyltransferase (UPF0157 family)
MSTDLSHDPLGVAHGEVRLAEPSSRWAELFAAEAARLEMALEWLGARVAHCGSTSVPGLVAKPILDILVGVPAPFDLDAMAAALTTLGYEHRPNAGVPDNEVFGRGNPRTHLLHVVTLDGESWHRMLRFRDALRRDHTLAAEYAMLKRSLAARYPKDRAAYTAAKGAFVERVLGEG